MKRSALPDQILQQIDNVIGVWEENPSFVTGPDVTIEKLKALRAQIDTCITEVQTANRVLTKWMDERDDCTKLGNEYLVRLRRAIQAYFGPDSTQYAQVGGTRRSERKSTGRRPKAPTLSEAA